MRVRAGQTIHRSSAPRISSCSFLFFAPVVGSLLPSSTPGIIDRFFHCVRCQAEDRQRFDPFEKARRFLENKFGGGGGSLGPAALFMMLHAIFRGGSGSLANGRWKMKTKMAVVASVLLVSVQTASAQYYY